MKIKFVVFLSIMVFFSCSNNVEETSMEVSTATIISPDQPFGILIKKERSYFESEKIIDRLQQLDIPAYAVENEDEDGRWYYVMTDALTDSIQADSVAKGLNDKLGMQGVSYINFNQLDTTAKVDFNKKELREVERIQTKRPDVPASVMQVIEKFPTSTAYRLERGNIFQSPASYQSKRDYRKFRERNYFHSELPAGLELDDIIIPSTAYAEATFTDNLNEQVAHLHIAYLQPQTDYTASFFNFTSFDAFEFTQKYVQMIEATSNYEILSKKEVTVASFTQLAGYRLRVSNEEGQIENHLYLTDPTGKYIIIAHSKDKTHKELVTLLKSAGKGEGLNDYNEFYNTFNVFPNISIADDLFFGYTFRRLDMSYAASKKYSDWSLELVGHYVAEGYLYNTKKGMWSFSLFDLISKERRQYIHETLYGRQVSGYAKIVDVYNEKGNVISQVLKNKEFFDELNFPKSRYIVTVNNSEYSDLNLEEMIKRAENLQLYEVDQMNKSDHFLN